MANAVFSCPRCGQVLGDIPPSGTLTATCVRCRLKYEVVRGQVSAAHSRKAEVQLQRHRFVHHYELRLELTGGRVESVRFDAPEADVPMLARTGDVVSAVYLLRGTKREQLLSVHNATAGGEIIISFPGDKAAAMAWRISGAIAAIVFITAGPLGASFLVAFSAALTTLAGLRLGVGRVLTHRVDVSSGEAARLSAAQQLLTEKIDLEAARARTVRELERRRELRDRLTALRAKMLNVGLELYQARIAAIDRALGLVGAQLELEVRLRDGYERSIQMLEIELETGAAADILGESAAPQIAATLAEMRDLETQQAELTRQLSANVEVEALLKST